MRRLYEMTQDAGIIPSGCILAQNGAKGIRTLKKTRVIVALVVGAAMIAGGLALLQNPRPNLPPAKPPVARPTPAPSARVTLYYVNDQYVRTGDESLPHLVAVERTLDLQGRSLADAVVRALMKPPEKEGLSTALGQLRLRGVEVRSATAYVDFSSENLSGGSLEESLLIDQVVRSLGSVNGVNAVQFLVNGRKTESLMGHLDALRPVPIKR